MKKIIVTLMSVCMIAFAVTAQTADETKASKVAEKEARAKQKALQAENIEKSLKEVGATEKEIATYREVVQEASVKGSVIKKNETLPAEDKALQLKAISDEKNTKLKDLLGADRFKAFNKLRKEQKLAEEALIADYKQ